jgi:hypothetical protein
MKTKHKKRLFVFTCRLCGAEESRMSKSRPWVCAKCRETKRIKNSIEQCKFLKEQRRVIKEQLKKNRKNTEGANLNNKRKRAKFIYCGNEKCCVVNKDWIMIMPEVKYCVVCGRVAENHHIRTRGASLRDKKELAENKIALCRAHHTECHSLGRWTFAVKYDLLGLFVDVIGTRKYDEWLKTQKEAKNG